MLMQLKSVTKTYPSFSLGPIDLNLEPGYVHGFVGPNGAGKTTTLKIMMGLLRRDSGSIRIQEKDVDLQEGSWKQDLGYVGEDQVFFESWRGSRILELYARMRSRFCMTRAETLAKRLNLDLNKRAKNLSKGNRVKLGLVANLAHQPTLLILDEPTSGLDPLARNEVLDIIHEVASDEHRAVLFSTHIMPDLARMADTVSFIKEGQIIRTGAPADITGPYRKIRFRFPFDKIDLPGIISHQVDGHNHLIVTSAYDQAKPILTQAGAMIGEATRISLDEAALYILRGDI